MPTLTEPLVQRPRGNLSSSSRDEFVQTDNNQAGKLVQGPVAYKQYNRNPRFKPLVDRGWGAW